MSNGTNANHAASPSLPATAKHHTRKPTGLAPDPLNIVILGASFGGLSCAHHFLDRTINQLRKTNSSPKYRLVIVSPSTHVYWNIGAPRALVGAHLLSFGEAFIEIEPGFHRHRGHDFVLLQGECTGMDTSARTVTVEVIGLEAQRRASKVVKRISMNAKGPQGQAPTVPNPKVQTIPYHALVMATGSSAHSDLLSLHGPHLHTMGALNAIHSKLPGAKSIIVCGGGPTGVETAGQLATYLNHTKRLFPFPGTSKAKSGTKKITLLTGSSRCLPKLKASVGMQAERQLRGLGVFIIHSTRVISAQSDFDLTGQTRVVLSDDTTMIADLYIACTGVSPNSSYVPAQLLDSGGYIKTQPATLRVEGAGENVYALGDVASYSQNYVLDVYAAVPVVMQNLLNDLLAHELRLASPYGGNQDEIDGLEDAKYVQKPVDSQLCPITRYGGVGVFFNYRVLSLMVHLLKGRDYRVGKAKAVLVDGNNPY